jgi:SAM-dependent methyltransferase
MNHHTSLFQHRIIAAELSGGTSQQHLHDAALRWLLSNPLAQSGDRIMDYGSGTGSLIHQVLQANTQAANLFACDIMPRPNELPKEIEWIEQDLNLPLPEYLSLSFDSILSLEAIEHLENPRFQFREWHRLLKPGGSAYITTPNPESWHSLGYLLLRGVPSSLSNNSYPAHLHALTAKELERCAKEAGFHSIQIDYSHRGRIPFCRSSTWQNAIPWPISVFTTNKPGAYQKRWSDTTILVMTKPV